MNINKKYVITTQPIEQAEKLEKLISNKNIKFIKWPLIKTETIEINDEIKSITENVNFYDWIIFTSKNGVSSFFSYFTDNELVNITKLKFATIGNSTANELSKFNIKANYINQGNTSEEFLKYLLKDIIKKNEQILIPLGNLAPNTLVEGLSIIADVKKIDVYKTLNISNINKKAIDLINDDNYEFIIFTSPSQFENFIELTKYKSETKKLKILSIGNTTTKFINNYGFDVSITAKKSTIEYLASEINKV
ncbi:MAG: uroporphyrinogen-III synthase [Bacteroidales bacterium]|nr:uroporphyrinogen-III synthase [Bacteroidales bacterium]MBN2756222.1 uroporphyrinogen-III synthase [Bacteroidales bacterium]